MALIILFSLLALLAVVAIVAAVFVTLTDGIGSLPAALVAAARAAAKVSRDSEEFKKRYNFA